MQYKENIGKYKENIKSLQKNKEHTVYRQSGDIHKNETVRISYSKI